MNEAVSGVITLWRDGIPFWFDIYADPICSILKGKMLLVGLDDVIPDHLYAVVALLSNGNPGMCQIILKEILMASRDDVKTALAAGEYPVYLRRLYLAGKSAPKLFGSRACHGE